MASLSRQLAEFAVGLTYEQLPEAVVKEVKRFLIDTAGCGLGGVASEDPEIVHKVVAELGGAKEATVIGSGLRTSSVNAALLNALMVRALDYNDIYWIEDPSHPSDIIPAAWALGETRGRSGKDLIVGIALAYEMEQRLCEIGKPGIRERGWHHATLTGFAAPICAGKMIGLDVNQMVNAIGISACHTFSAGAVTAGKLTMMKNTVDPMATAAGVFAALLAERGYTGPEEIFEGREGLAHCLGAGWDWEALTENLGSDWRILRCCMKPYPTEGLTHSPISAALEVRKEHKIAPDDIAEIVIRTTKRGAEILCDKDKYDPHTKETADHSLPYCIAVAMVDGALVPASFEKEKLRDPQILAVCQKVKGVVDPEVEKIFPAVKAAIVTVKTRDGKGYTKRVDYAKGDYRNPLDKKELLTKFRALTSMLPPRKQNRIVRLIERLETVENVGKFMRAMVIPKEKKNK